MASARKAHSSLSLKDVEKCSDARTAVPLCRILPPTVAVAAGAEYDAQIEDTARGGDGIARVEGFVVFVPGTEEGIR